MHNTDRLYPSYTSEQIRNHVLELCSKGRKPLTREQLNLVVDAVLNHGKKNAPTDSPVLVCLKDADKLANIEPFNIIARCALQHPELPLVDSKFVYEVDPDSTYKEPKTIFRDAIHSTLEWETWFRLPKAIELARPYFDGLREVQRLTLRQLSETNLDQWPS